MLFRSVRTDLRLLVGAFLLPVVVACDSDFSVVPSTGSSPSAVADPVVAVTSENTGVTGVGAPECVDSPPIGDGWGWNGTESCRIGSPADSTAVVVSTSTETTSTQAAECVDTAPTGDGWGWNGTESCRIGGPTETTSVIETITVAECVDSPPIGDGFGWNGTESCRLDGAPILADTSRTQNNDSQPTGTLVTPLLSGITDLVLVTGQSNALGAGTSFDEFLDAPNQEVLAYTDEGWQIASLNQVWDLNWFPRNDPNTPPSNNLSLHFGKGVANGSSNRVVGFILVSSPGSPISDWGPGTPLFNSIRTKVSQAINDLPLKSRLDGIIWHQGESDGADRDEYSAALYDLITRFRSEPWFDDGRPFICGETARSPVNNQLNRLNTDADPWTSCIEAEGLAVLPGTDHFTAESLRTIGQRYADEYLRVWLGIQ